VDLAVTSWTQKHEVGEVGGAAVRPEPDVVGVAPGGWGPAPDAAAVADREGAALGGGDGAGGAADVERL
jgi:hypothetical protein